MFKIGEFSKLSKITVRMLRHYDDVGLLKPYKIDNFTGYRFYSANQLVEAIKISTYRDMGFNIAEISNLIISSDEEVKNYILKKIGEINQSISSENEKIKMLENKMKNLGREYIMSYEVNIKSLPTIKVISLRDTITNYFAESELWVKICEYAEENKIKQLNDMGITIYHDEEHKESNCDVEVCLIVEQFGKDDNKFIYRELEPVEKVASIVIVGGYEKMSGAVQFLGKWVEENGYIICGKHRQITIKHPMNESNPDNYVTEYQIPIK